MYGNGVVIGMEVIQVTHRQIRKDLLRALTVCFVVALGTAVRGAAVPPVVAAAICPILATFSASASLLPYSLTCCFLSNIAKLKGGEEFFRKEFSGLKRA